MWLLCVVLFDCVCCVGLGCVLFVVWCVVSCEFLGDVHVLLLSGGVCDVYVLCCGCVVVMGGCVVVCCVFVDCEVCVLCVVWVVLCWLSMFGSCDCG